MPTFEIPDGPTSVDIARSGDPKTIAPAEGSAVFNVTNKAAEGRSGRLSVQVAGSSKAEWFTIDGDRERPFAAGETQTATIKIKIPNDVAAGDYPFRLRVVEVNDPDNDHAEGPVTTAKLARPGTPNPHSFLWLWIVLGILAVIAIAAAVYFVVSSKKDTKKPPVEKPPVVTPAEAKVPNFTNQNIDAIPANASGYVIIRNETPNTNHEPRQVYDQDPKADTPLAAGGKVILSYEPGVVVPDLPSGATFTSAPNTLRSAGLEPGNYLCDSTSGSPGAQVGKVTAFVPGSGTRVAANSKVDMRAIQSGICRLRYIPVTKLGVHHTPTVFLPQK